MMDDSKHTEEVCDISRSDFTETHSEDTIRNLQRVGVSGLNGDHGGALRKAIGA